MIFNKSNTDTSTSLDINTDEDFVLVKQPKPKSYLKSGKRRNGGAHCPCQRTCKFIFGAFSPHAFTSDRFCQGNYERHEKLRHRINEIKGYWMRWN